MRLRTFGCSFTNYIWPTWNSFLALDPKFKEYDNWGLQGLGNQAISERFIESIAEKPLTKKDVVIIEWSGIERFDYFQLPNGWTNTGALAWAGWADQRWFDMFYSHEGYAMHWLNRVVQCMLILEKSPATWYMTTMSDMGLFKQPDLSKGNNNNIWAIDPKLSKYRYVFERNREHWLQDFTEQEGEHYWFDPTKDKHPWRDWHLTPAQHLWWLNRHVLPKLGLHVTDRQAEAAKELTQALETSKNLVATKQSLLHQFKWWESQQAKLTGYPFN